MSLTHKRIKKGIVIRRASQTFFLLLFTYILWSTTYPLKGILPPETFFKINPLVMLITSLSERTALGGGILYAVIMLIAACIAGRFFCGWICPLGTSIDIAHLIRKTPRTSDAVNAAVRLPKFFILAIIALCAIAGVQVAWVLDPMAIMARFISLNFIPGAILLVNALFVALIKATNFYGPLYDFYRSLTSGSLGIRVYFFAHSFSILLFFLAIVGSSLILARLWCRAVCPLGGMYAVCAPLSKLRRRVCACSGCGICNARCRMGAIREDLSYRRGECILCLDCVYDCPEHATHFAWGSRAAPAAGTAGADNDAGGISRAQFMSLVLASLLAAGFGSLKKIMPAPRRVIRPPASLPEDEFLNRCVRCGNCMKVCITNGLQPALLQTGIGGLWTPHLVPEIGYCEYDCTLCGNTCPTGAIRRLSVREKRSTVLGTAVIDRALCIPWKQEKDCIVCEEHCPVPEKAIKLFKDELSGSPVLKPYVDTRLCVGCGICQNKCPLRPARAVRVTPR